MSPDCRNDCRDPFEFPRRIHNRPGLSRINYRIGTYSLFLEKILRDLNRNQVLRDWTHRDGDDPGIALLEGASILGDILTFYQEVYANEAYLRTAQWRDSIADLVRLLGYRLSPGLGGRATFAFEVKGDKPVVIPAGLLINAQVEELEQPADFESVVQSIAYPELSKFHFYRTYFTPAITDGTNNFAIDTAVLREKNIQLNEGDQILLAVKKANTLSRHQVAIIEKIQRQFDKTEIHIKGSWQQGFAGDVVFAYKIGRSFRHFGYNSPPKFTELVDGKAQQTGVDFERKSGSLLENGKFVKESPQLQGTGSNSANPAANEVGSKSNYSPVGSDQQLPLDIEIDDLSVGSKVLLRLQRATDDSGGGEEHLFARTVAGVTRASLTMGAVTGGSTVLTLGNGGLLSHSFSKTNSPNARTDIRTVEIMEVLGDQFSLQGRYEEDPAANLDTLQFFGDGQGYQHLDERQLLLVKDDGTVKSASVNIDEAHIPPADEQRLRPVFPTLTTGLTIADFPLRQSPQVTVYGNLVEATQGKTESETVLGNGDSRKTFQTFKLPKTPLTYLNSAGAAPPEVPELQIYVGDQRWTRVPSMFGRGPKEEIYIVREDAEGNSWVQFGDGVTGARLPSGIDNIVATFRSGTGAYGALKEETTVQVRGRLDRFDKAHLPGVASGGDAPESGENARESAPGKIQSLDRLVSLKDFESETLAVAGVSKALAVWDLVDNVPNVVLTVLVETGREHEFQQMRQILADYNRCRGPQRFPVCVRQGLRQYVYLDAVYGLHPSFRKEPVQKAIKKAFGLAGGEDNGSMVEAGLFALRNRNFGQDEYASRIAAAIQNVDGVLWAKITALGLLANAADDLSEIDPCSFAAASDPSELIFPAEPKGLSAVIACDSRHILSLFPEHLQLSPVSVPSAEVC